jgi:hypothetical protein
MPPVVYRLLSTLRVFVIAQGVLGVVIGVLLLKSYGAVPIRPVWIGYLVLLAAGTLIAIMTGQRIRSLCARARLREGGVCPECGADLMMERKEGWCAGCERPFSRTSLRQTWRLSDEANQ